MRRKMEIGEYVVIRDIYELLDGAKAPVRGLEGAHKLQTKKRGGIGMEKRAVELLRDEIAKKGDLANYARYTGNTIYVYANECGELEAGTSPIGMADQGYAELVAQAKFNSRQGYYDWTIASPGSDEIVRTDRDGNIIIDVIVTDGDGNIIPD
jgi:hypothetical protein